MFENIVTFILFVLAVAATLDYITDVIEVMSGRSEDHNKLEETTPSMNYMCGVILMWALFYLFKF